MTGILAWSIVVVLALAGEPTAALSGALFFAAVFAPAVLVFCGLLSRAGVTSPLDVLASAALAFMALAFVFILRAYSGISGGLFDVVLAVGLWTAARPLLSSEGIVVIFRRWMSSGGSRADLWWALLWLPILFLAVRSGHEVRTGGAVHYYGLNFVDFGNLVAYVNLLNATPGLPLQEVVGGGPLSYHWLFFAVPAWMATFAGITSSPSGALTLANFAGALLFYKTLSRACAVALQESGRSKDRWCAWGAGVGVFALTIFSIYMMVVGRLGFLWSTGRGLRNHLLLQLPNSINIFGNNTLALTMILLGVLSIVMWNKTARFAYAGLAAVLVSFVPALSATMVPAVAGGFALAALCGAVRQPVRVLAVFALLGAVALAVFWWIGLFSGRSETPAFEFDGGLYLRNIVGSAPLCVVAVAWCFAKARTDIAWLLAGLMAGAFLLPTLLDLRGSYGEGAHLSMKNFSLFVCASAPLVAVMVVDAAKLWRRRVGLVALIALLLGAGLLNSIGYAASYPWRVLTGAKAAVTLDGNLYDALVYVREHSPPTAIVATPLVDEIATGNPITTVAARRCLLPNEYSRRIKVTQPETSELAARWGAWLSAGYPPGNLSAEFAKKVDFVVLDHELPPDDWQQAAAFGEIRVFVPREGAPHETLMPIR